MQNIPINGHLSFKFCLPARWAFDYHKRFNHRKLDIVQYFLNKILIIFYSKLIIFNFLIFIY